MFLIMIFDSWLLRLHEADNKALRNDVNLDYSVCYFACSYLLISLDD